MRTPQIDPVMLRAIGFTVAVAKNVSKVVSASR